MPSNSPANVIASCAVLLCWIGFAAVMLRSRMAGGADGGVARRDLGSILGIALQGVGMALAWAARFQFAWPVGGADWLPAIPPAAIAFLSVALFAWSTRTMGANWSLVARTRDDHTLVQSGPFAFVRNPIYIALFGMMSATAIALGHWVNLIAAIPLYLIGTVLRVHIEEKLLRQTFGQAFDDYARRVKRFIPGVW
ncbi:MAG TPA: isoprenylcysteine carboxylmethyltransferase family protein [Hyphomonadaceae bacterium]|nr:isoprenylcysteine carboxylmethyltransferase family protein [Hyphomonadaceae bacterium]